MSPDSITSSDASPSLSRRAYLGAVAAGAAGGLAGCTSDGNRSRSRTGGGGGGGAIGTSSGQEITTSVARDTYAERFDRVVDAVQAGADPEGQESINPVLNSYATPGTLLVFPSGTYKMTGPHRIPRDGTVGIVGQNAVIKHAPVSEIAGHDARGEYSGDTKMFSAGSSTSPFSGFLVFGGFIFDFSPQNSGMQCLNAHIEGESIVENIQVYGEQDLGTHGPFRLSTQSDGSIMHARNIDMRYGGKHYVNTINTRSTPQRYGSDRPGPSWSTSGMTITSTQAGTILATNIHAGSWPDNGLYLKGGEPSRGRVGRKIIRNCTAANSNVANIRTNDGPAWEPHPWVDGDGGTPAEGYENSVIENCEVVVNNNYDTSIYGNQLGIRLDDGAPVVRNSRVALQKPNGTGIRVQDPVSGGRVENCRVDLWEPESGIVMAGDGEVVDSVVNTIGFSASGAVAGISSGVNVQQVSPEQIQAQQQQQQQQQGRGGAGARARGGATQGGARVRGGTSQGSAGAQGGGTQDRASAPVAAVQQGWGQPDESKSSNFRQGDLEGKWSQWGDGEACQVVDTWNGHRCGRNSEVTDGMHRIEGTVDGESGGATSTSTFTYGRIEWSERAYCADNCQNETYNVTPIIYPDSPESQIAGNGEIDVAERRIGDSPFFVIHWNDENYYIQADVDGTTWHNYAVDWQPDRITWYIDGQRVESWDVSVDIVANFNAGQMDMFPSTGTPMHHAFYELDWVRFYPPDGSGPSPVPQNDHPGGRNWTPTNVRKGMELQD